MSEFEDARTEYNRLSSGRTWVSSVLGDTYYTRYPIDAGTQEAMTYKRSIFKGDDSVHEWDATGVRQKIIQRIIETQQRTIRPWYGELSFFSDQLRFLPPLPESELDFVLRTSLYPADEDDDIVAYKEAREELLGRLDPNILPEDEVEDDPIRSAFRGWESPEDVAKKYSKVQIELYGLLNAIKDRMHVLTDEEILEIIEVFLDIDMLDRFLLKRFVDPNLKDDDIRPLVGQGNPDVRTKNNFILKYIGGGDRQFFIRRIFQLWLRNLLDFDKQAVEYIEEIKFDILEDFSDDEEEMHIAILQAIKLYKLYNQQERLLSQLKTEYATQLDFKGYRSEIIHLLNRRNEIFSEFSQDDFRLPIEPSNYDPDKICYEIGVKMIESTMKYLASQIPEPEGVGGKIQSRVILNKRINNLKKYVLTDEIRDELLSSISQIYRKTGTDEEADIEREIRKIRDRLVPRGEHFFQEIKTEVKEAMAQAGDKDLRQELKQSTDDPQTLVKQYGHQAIGMVEDEAKISELYSTILGLKSAELMFSGSVTMTPLKRRKITQSLIEDLYVPQFRFLKMLKQEESVVDEGSEE